MGCGSGRDTAYFIKKGYRVEAIDGCKNFCKSASRYTKIPVRHMYFHDLEYEDEFHGIWACASLLHISLEELPDILKKINKALKDGGLLYMTFKYGSFQGYKVGRYFSYLNEELLGDLLNNVGGFELLDISFSGDLKNEKLDRWINISLKKL